MPIVKVQTTVLGVAREFSALVDSGADITMLPAKLLAAYGVDLATLPQNGFMIGASGAQMPKYLYTMELWYRDRRFAAEANVLPNIPVPVLGRDDFLRQFGIHFHWNDIPPTWCVRKIRNPR